MAGSACRAQLNGHVPSSLAPLTWLAVAQPHLGGIDQLRQRRKLVACQSLPHAVRVLLAASKEDETNSSGWR